MNVILYSLFNALFINICSTVVVMQEMIQPRTVNILWTWNLIRLRVKPCYHNCLSFVLKWMLKCEIRLCGTLVTTVMGLYAPASLSVPLWPWYSTLLSIRWLDFTPFAFYVVDVYKYCWQVPIPSLGVKRF